MLIDRHTVEQRLERYFHPDFHDHEMLDGF
jgi:hypothetical protein